MKQRLGQNIRAFRERLGLSQFSLAEAAGVTETAIGLIERGKRWPQYVTIERVSRVLGVPIEALFEGAASVVKPTPDEAIKIIQEALKKAKEMSALTKQK